MAENVAIGVDIGGTATKIGLVTSGGEILRRLELQTPHHLPAQALVDSISGLLEQLVSDAESLDLRPLGMGISICGYLTPDGLEPDYVNLHALDHYPLVRHFERRFGYPVVMDNDMNCGVLGEFHFGGGIGVSRLMVMTVGTGIGMGVMLDGVVMRFHGGTVGNPGHTIVSAGGSICVAGCRGCLESLASAGPIARLAEDMARSQRPSLLRAMLEQKGCLTPEDLFQAAEAGDQPAQEIWNQVGQWLGRGLATWVEIFGPQVVIVGGGVAGAGHWLVDPIESELRRVGEPYFTRQVKAVQQSRSGKDSAMLGAASLYLFPEHLPHWGKAAA